MASWRQRAACRGMNPGLFYPERGAAFDVAEAKRACERCEVRTECLIDCARYEHDWDEGGIRGGLSANQRRKVGRHTILALAA